MMFVKWMVSANWITFAVCKWTVCADLEQWPRGTKTTHIFHRIGTFVRFLVLKVVSKDSVSNTHTSDPRPNSILLRLLILILRLLFSIVIIIPVLGLESQSLVTPRTGLLSVGCGGQYVKQDWSLTQ